MLFGQILIFVLFFLVLTNCVFGTYEESHDVTRCVMLNGVPMVGAEGGFIHRRRGWRPRGAWGATWGPPPPAIWGNLTPMMIRLSCEVRTFQFEPLKLRRSQRFGHHSLRSVGRLPKCWSWQKLICPLKLLGWVFFAMVMLTCASILLGIMPKHEEPTTF